MTDKRQIAILRKALVDVVQKLGEMPGWISVKQELPRTGKLCLVVYSGCVQHIPYSREGIGYACKEGYEWRCPEHIDEGGDPIPDGDITHWMYQPILPAAPSDSTPTLAETLQAICASALGDAEIGGDE